MTARIKDVIANEAKSSGDYTLKRLEGNHLSDVAICGLKYKYVKENKLVSPYTLKYMRGTAIEDKIYYATFRFDSSYQHHVLLTYTYKGITFYGAPDFVSFRYNHIIEFKTTKQPGAYTDIYMRQLKAYMIAYEDNTGIKPSGTLWEYNIYNDNVVEIDAAVSDTDRAALEASVEAYITGVFTPGLQNSICAWCENITCPIRAKGGNDGKTQTQ